MQKRSRPNTLRPNTLRPSTSRQRRQPSTTSQGQIRIIGGEWRGRKLPVLLSDGLRPSGDRVRETLFNWLQADIRGARCLDAFAGSGALGLEALSRGAAHCTLLELAPAVFQQLNANLATLGLTTSTQNMATMTSQSRCQLIQVDTNEWLSHPRPKEVTPFDGVFLDPPFAAGIEENTWVICFESLCKNGWLADNSWVYLEAPRNYALPAILPNGWQLDRHKTSGAIQFCLFRGSRD